MSKKGAVNLGEEPSSAPNIVLQGFKGKAVIETEGLRVTIDTGSASTTEQTVTETKPGAYAEQDSDGFEEVAVETGTTQQPYQKVLLPTSKYKSARSRCAQNQVACKEGIDFENLPVYVVHRSKIDSLPIGIYNCGWDFIAVTLPGEKLFGSGVGLKKVRNWRECIEVWERFHTEDPLLIIKQ